MTLPRVGEPGPRGPGHWPCGGRESARLRCLPLDTALRREGVRTPALSPPITLSITLSGTEMTALGPERTR